MTDYGLRYGIKISYDVYIQQQRNGRWTTKAVEYAPFSFLHSNPLISRPLQIEHTYTFPSHGSMYVNLFLDLGTIGYPDQYHMYSYVESNNDTKTLQTPS